LEVKSEKSKIKEDEIRLLIKGRNIDLITVQNVGENGYILKLKQIDDKTKGEFLVAIKEKYQDIEEVSFNTVGPILGKELIRKTILAVILSAGFIMLYVGRRFKDKVFGMCAILAMLHDTIILLGAFSLLGHFLGVEIDTLFVTAVLTVLSFSVHDTVVVYDRIREGMKLFPKAKLEDLVNKAVAETLVRSINNSLTIIFMLMALYLLGGSSIRWFVFALLVGTVSGTYSSTFTAAPLLVVWDKLRKKELIYPEFVEGPLRRCL